MKEISEAEPVEEGPQFLSKQNKQAIPTFTSTQSGFWGEHLQIDGFRAQT